MSVVNLIFEDGSIVAAEVDPDERGRMPQLIVHPKAGKLFARRIAGDYDEVVVTCVLREPGQGTLTVAAEDMKVSALAPPPA